MPARNGLDLGGEQILLVQTVLLTQQLEQHGLDRLLFLAIQRTATDDQVEIFAGDDLSGVLVHLLAGQMDQQVRNADHGVVFILADDDIDLRSVLPDRHAVQRQCPGDPLVFLYAAIVVRVGKGQIGVLVKGILLQVDARRVDVRADDVDAVGKELFAQMEQHDRLAHLIDVHLVARPERLARANRVVQIDIAMLLRHFDGLRHALALGLAVVQKVAIAKADIFQRLKRLRVIAFPCVGSFHGRIPPFPVWVKSSSLIIRELPRLVN